MKKIIQDFLDVDKIVCPNCKKKNYFAKSGTISKRLKQCMNCDYEIEGKEYSKLLPPYNGLRKLFGFCLFMTIVFSTIIIHDSNKSEKLDNLIHNGIILDYVPIIDKQYNKGKTFDGENAYNLYKYNFQVLDKRIDGGFLIRLNPRNIKAPPYIQNFNIGDNLTILYLEENPEVHTVVKINDYFTILPTDTVSYIFPFESNAFTPELKCIARYKNIN